MNSAAHGVVWGAVATVPMSVAMLVGQKLGWMRKQPPEALTEEALRRADVSDATSETTIDVLTVASHFAFGAGAGALYGLLRQAAPNAPAIPLGIAFGLGVWAASYRGWIPAMHILPTEQRPGRDGTTVMIAAHVVYGATLGAQARRHTATPK